MFVEGGSCSICSSLSKKWKPKKSKIGIDISWEHNGLILLASSVKSASRSLALYIEQLGVRRHFTRHYERLEKVGPLFTKLEKEPWTRIRRHLISPGLIFRIHWGDHHGILLKGEKRTKDRYCSNFPHHNKNSYHFFVCLLCASCYAKGF